MSTLVGRYLYSDTPRNTATGAVQVTPPGLTNNNPSNNHSLNLWANSVFGSSTSNELRVAWAHLGTVTEAENPLALEIPSIEISELGMTARRSTATPASRSARSVWIRGEV